MSLISWDRRVDLQAPAVDAASHALTRGDALLAQPVDDVQAPDAVMTKHDEQRIISLRVETGQLGGDRSHRNQLGFADASELELVWLAHIDQRELRTGLQALLDFLWRNFEG
jgi:hypothetical protein